MFVFSFFLEYNLCYYFFCFLVILEDGCFVDFGFRVDIEEKGFYTENFYLVVWVFRGDDGNFEDSFRCFSKKFRLVVGKDFVIMVKLICFREFVVRF